MADDSARKDTGVALWQSGERYHRFMGRWSAQVAATFVDRLDLPAGLAWLDVGCGAGDLLGVVLAERSPARITGLDLSAPFLETARARWGGQPGVDFTLGSAEDLPFADATFDAVVSGLAINFPPDSERVVAEMVRVARPGATVGAYVWDYEFPGFFLTRFWDAAEVVLGERAHATERGRWHICTQTGLGSLARRAGLAGVRVRGITVDTVFDDRDSLWEGFELGIGPAGTLVRGLDADERRAVRQEIERHLPALREDGAVALRARSWAFTAARPTEGAAT